MIRRRDRDAVFVVYEPSCVVPDDPGEVVRHAAPVDDRARRQLLEQHIERLLQQSDGKPSRAIPRRVGSTSSSDGDTHV